MAFGKRVEKVRKDVSKHSEAVDKVSEKVSSENSSVHNSDNSVDSSDNVSDSNVKQKKVKNQRASSFLKKISKSKKPDVLLFGQTKEEKLELFIKNIKIIHPNIPKFWLQREVEKFKRKFNIQDDE